MKILRQILMAILWPPFIGSRVVNLCAVGQLILMPFPGMDIIRTLLCMGSITGAGLALIAYLRWSREHKKKWDMIQAGYKRMQAHLDQALERKKELDELESEGTDYSRRLELQEEIDALLKKYMQEGDEVMKAL